MNSTIFYITTLFKIPELPIHYYFFSKEINEFFLYMNRFILIEHIFSGFHRESTWFISLRKFSSFFVIEMNSTIFPFPIFLNYTIVPCYIVRDGALATPRISQTNPSAFKICLFVSVGFRFQGLQKDTMESLHIGLYIALLGWGLIYLFTRCISNSRNGNYLAYRNLFALKLLLLCLPLLTMSLVFFL